MAIALVNSVKGESGASSVSSLPAASFAASAGNLIAVLARYDSTQTITSITDTAGNTYVSAIDVSATVGKLSLWYAKNTVANIANIITVNFSASAAFCVVEAAQYSGLHLTSPLDVAVGGSSTGTGTVATSPAASTAVADEVVIAGGMVSNLGAAWSSLTPLGYTAEQQDSNAIAIFADQIYSSTLSTTTWTYTNTDTVSAKAICVASFKIASAGGVALHSLASLGVGV